MVGPGSAAFALAVLGARGWWGWFRVSRGVAGLAGTGKKVPFELAARLRWESEMAVVGVEGMFALVEPRGRCTQALYR